MKLINSKEETVWITGNKPFRLFAIGNKLNSLIIDKEIDTIIGSIMNHSLRIIVRSSEDVKVLSDIFRNQGYNIQWESCEIGGLGETFYSLEDFKDCSDPYYHLFEYKHSYFQIPFREEDAPDFLVFIKKLSSDFGYKTPYSFVSDGGRYVTVIK